MIKIFRLKRNGYLKGMNFIIFRDFSRILFIFNLNFLLFYFILKRLKNELSLCGDVAHVCHR